MGLLDGGASRLFGNIMGAFYPDAALHRAIITDDGHGGGSTGYAEPETVKAQLDKTIERMIDGNPEMLQSIFVLQKVTVDGVQTDVDKPSTDDEITTGDGQRWQIAIVETDPANAYFLLGGRKSGFVAEES